MIVEENMPSLFLGGTQVCLGWAISDREFRGGMRRELVIEAQWQWCGSGEPRPPLCNKHFLSGELENEQGLGNELASNDE